MNNKKGLSSIWAVVILSIVFIFFIIGIFLFYQILEKSFAEIEEHNISLDYEEKIDSLEKEIDILEGKLEIAQNEYAYLKYQHENPDNYESSPKETYEKLYNIITSYGGNPNDKFHSTKNIVYFTETSGIEFVEIYMDYDAEVIYEFDSSEVMIFPDYDSEKGCNILGLSPIDPGVFEVWIKNSANNHKFRIIVVYE